MKNREVYDDELKDDTPLPADMEIKRIRSSEQRGDDDELQDDMPLPDDLEIREDD